MLLFSLETASCRPRLGKVLANATSVGASPSMEALGRSQESIYTILQPQGRISAGLGPLPACLPNLFLKAWVMPSCLLCPCSLVFVLDQEKSHPCFPNPNHMLFWFHLNPILTSSSRFFFFNNLNVMSFVCWLIGWGMKILVYQTMFGNFPVYLNCLAPRRCLRCFLWAKNSRM